MHHGSKSSKELEEEARRLGLGPTGQFPDGKLDETDEGEIKIGITVMNDKVVLNFGSPVAYLGMSPSQARRVGRLLIKRANRAETPRRRRRSHGSN